MSTFWVLIRIEMVESFLAMYRDIVDALGNVNSMNEWTCGV